ncbi:MAG: methylenetetrahydrofolate reductase C-terminal domain-containing protein [Thermoguttaceae bacterium]|nr:methylenetetrahydrofolate reductase C-terminal domain-containing protein [Thermoguttaceae bacterium]
MAPLTPGVSLRDMLGSERFYYGAEVVTSRGFPAQGEPNQLFELGRALLSDPRIGWVSITDNPGGAPMLPPDWLGRLLAEQRPRVVLHMTCKDMNRNGLEAAAWRYAAEGFENLLAITGDYPTTGFGGTADPVFDLDSIGLIALLRSMNQGLRVPSRRGGTETLPKTHFYIGCAVSPFKQHERELMPQYFKLLRKIRAGAEWVIPQLGYDMRKFHEVKLFLEARGVRVPVIGNVYLLNRAVATLFHSGKLAGCVVSDSLLDEVNKQAAGPDKGKKFFRELAAKQLAVFKGLGFAAGYLGGISKAETFFEIIDLAEQYGENDWKDFIKEIRYSNPGEFFLFEHDPETALSAPDRINRQYLESLKKPEKSRHVTLGYRLSRKVHDWAFHRGKGLYGLLARIYARWDRKPGFLSRLAYWLEREAKHLGYGCQDCGDCSLPDCAYLCPLAACSKHSRNGPCGGSAGGKCELLDKECFWARVYERLKYYGESERMLDGPIVVYDARLKHSSAWANTYLDRDHAGRPAPDQTPASPQEPQDKPPP